MKLIASLAAGVLLSLAVVIVPWITFFNGSLSGEPQNWAQFGDYVGGTLSPLISAWAFIALLYNLRQQQEEIIQMRKQAGKEDLLRAIGKLEDDFYKSLTRYPVKITSSDKTLGNL